MLRVSDLRLDLLKLAIRIRFNHILPKYYNCNLLPLRNRLPQMKVKINESKGYHVGPWLKDTIKVLREWEMFYNEHFLSIELIRGVYLKWAFKNHDLDEISK